LLTELRQLERKTATGGKDGVDHPPRGHDDLANSACGALLLCKSRELREHDGTFTFETSREDISDEFVRRVSSDDSRPWDGPCSSGAPWDF